MKFIITSLFSMFLFLTNAQVELGEWVHPGQIITKDSAVKKGYIRVIANNNHPWGYQSKIRFMEEEKWNNLAETPGSSEFEKYSPGDILGYSLTDLNFTYLTRPFSDMSSVGIGMIAKKYFMKVIEDGKIKLFHYYDAPPDVYVGSAEDLREIESSSMNNYALLQIGNQKLKNLTDVDIRELISDCPKVLADYEAGKYGPSPSDTGKKKGLAKFLSKVNDSNKMKDYIAPVIKDYNLCN